MNKFEASYACAPAEPRYDLECALEMDGRLLPVFPMLMPQTWERAPTQLCEPILRGVSLAHVPLLAPVHFLGEPGLTEFRRIYLRTERLAAIGTSLAELMGEAFANLRRRPASWMLVGRELAMCSDDYLAAERIFDAAHMRAAAALLGGPGEPIVAAVPRRGHLIATRLSQLTRDPGHAHAFGAAAAQMFAQGKSDAISPWSFLVDDGRIDTILEIA